MCRLGVEVVVYNCMLYMCKYTYIWCICILLINLSNCYTVDLKVILQLMLTYVGRFPTQGLHWQTLEPSWQRLTKTLTFYGFSPSAFSFLSQSFWLSEKPCLPLLNEFGPADVGVSLYDKILKAVLQGILITKAALCESMYLPANVFHSHLCFGRHLLRFALQGNRWLVM